MKGCPHSISRVFLSLFITASILLQSLLESTQQVPLPDVAVLDGGYFSRDHVKLIQDRDQRVKNLLCDMERLVDEDVAQLADPKWRVEPFQAETSINLPITANNIQAIGLRALAQQHHTPNLVSETGGNFFFHPDRTLQFLLYHKKMQSQFENLLSVAATIARKGTAGAYVKDITDYLDNYKPRPRV